MRVRYATVEDSFNILEVKEVYFMDDLFGNDTYIKGFQCLTHDDYTLKIPVVGENFSAEGVVASLLANGFYDFSDESKFARVYSSIEEFAEDYVVEGYSEEEPAQEEVKSIEGAEAVYEGAGTSNIIKI